MNALQAAMKNYTKNKTEKVLIIDVYNTVFRTIYFAFKEANLKELNANLELAVKSGNQTDIDKCILEIDEAIKTALQYFKYLFVNSVIQYTKKFKPTKLILASDDRNYWRGDIYPEYKAQRKGHREKSDIPYDVFFPEFEKFMGEFKAAFSNVHFLKVERCEADDIIAVLCKKKFINSDYINVSTDKDFYQLKQHPKYQQYNPISKKMIQHLNPKQELTVKILTGDGGDNIPGVRAKVGPVTAAKMIKEGLTTALDTPDMKSNYTRNKQLIDLDMIPLKWENDILEAYDNSEIKKYNSGNVWTFLLNHKQKYLAENISVFSEFFKDLN